MTGTVTSSSRCCLFAGGFRSLSRRWQNHICSCLSVSPNCTDSSARFVSFGYESSAPTQHNANRIPMKNTHTIPIDSSQKQIQNTQIPEQPTNLYRSSRGPPTGRGSPFSSMCWKVAIWAMASLSFWNSAATLRGPCVRRCSRRRSAWQAMSTIVLTLGGDASPFVASSVILQAKPVIRQQGRRTPRIAGAGTRTRGQGSGTHSCVGVTSVSASRAERILPAQSGSCR